MRYIVYYETNHFKLDVPPDGDVRWIKKLLREKIGSDTGEKLVLHHGNTELQDNWVLSKLACSIPAGSVIHCTLCKNKIDIELELEYSGKRHSILEEFHRANTVFDLKCEIQYSLGIPISSFTLYFSNQKMYDTQLLSEFNIYAPATIVLISWKGWNKFLWCATEGRIKQLANCMERDRLVCKYQQRVAMFIAAHHNHVDMASHLLQLGTSCSRPVGVHPSKSWCELLQKPHPELVPPIFHAVAKGNLDVVRLFLEEKPDLLLNVNSEAKSLVDVAIVHGQQKCAEYMRMVKLRTRSTQFTKYSYTWKLIVQLIHWRRIASGRIKPFKLNKHHRKIRLSGFTKRGMFIDGIHDNRIGSPQRNNVQINKQKFHSKSLTPADSKPSINTVDGTSPSSLRLPSISSSPLTSRSSSFHSPTPSCTSTGGISTRSMDDDTEYLANLPPLREDSTSPLDRSGAAPTIRVKKYDQFLFERKNCIYRKQVLNEPLFSLALRCMETANMSCHKRSWMRQLQVAVSLGKSNVMQPRITTTKFQNTKSG